MDPQEFLTDLWGNPPPGVALIWTLPNNRSRWYTRFDEVTREMKDLSLKDVYTGVGIANRNGNRFNSLTRFTEAEVGGLAGMVGRHRRGPPRAQKAKPAADAGAGP